MVLSDLRARTFLVALAGAVTCCVAGAVASETPIEKEMRCLVERAEMMRHVGNGFAEIVHRDNPCGGLVELSKARPHAERVFELCEGEAVEKAQEFMDQSRLAEERFSGQCQ